MFTWQAHDGAVTSLAFSPDGRSLATCGTDGRLRVRDALTGEVAAEGLLARPGVHEPAPGRRAECGRPWFSPEGDRVAVALPEAGVLVLDARQGERACFHRMSAVRAMKAVPHSGLLLAMARPEVGPSESSLLQFEFALWVVPFGYDPDSVRTFHRNLWRPIAFAVSPDGTKVATDGAVYGWPHGELLGLYPVKNQEIAEYEFSADGNRLFGLCGGKVFVWTLWPFAASGKLKGHTGRVTAMAVTPDGRKLWTAGHDATVRCWDTGTLTLEKTYRLTEGGLNCLAVSPDGTLAAVGSGQKGTVTVWDL